MERERLLRIAQLVVQASKLAKLVRPLERQAASLLGKGIGCRAVAGCERCMCGRQQVGCLAALQLGSGRMRCLAGGSIAHVHQGVAKLRVQGCIQRELF